MKEIHWGFIGCGEVTEKKSGPAFNKVEGSYVEAVMSRSKEKARLYAERHQIKKWYTDAQELINDSNVNAIYIATPPSSHATFAIMAMKAGKPVYIEISLHILIGKRILLLIINFFLNFYNACFILWFGIYVLHIRLD